MHYALNSILKTYWLYSWAYNKLQQHTPKFKALHRKQDKNSTTIANICCLAYKVKHEWRQVFKVIFMYKGTSGSVQTLYIIVWALNIFALVSFNQQQKSWTTTNAVWNKSNCSCIVKVYKLHTYHQHKNVEYYYSILYLLLGICSYLTLLTREHIPVLLLANGAESLSDNFSYSKYAP